MGDSSHTGMLQLPECGAQTHRVGKGSREEAWEGGTGEGRQTQEGAGEKHKGFHIAIGWGWGGIGGNVDGASPFQTF